MLRCSQLIPSHPLLTSIDALGGTIARAKNQHGVAAGPLRLYPGGVAQARG